MTKIPVNSFILTQDAQPGRLIGYGSYEAHSYIGQPFNYSQRKNFRLSNIASTAIKFKHDLEFPGMSDFKFLVLFI